MDAWMLGPRLLTPGSSSSPSPALQHRVYVYFSPFRISRRLHPVASIPGPISGDRAGTKTAPELHQPHTPDIITHLFLLVASPSILLPQCVASNTARSSVLTPHPYMTGLAMYLYIRYKLLTHRPKSPCALGLSPEWGMSYWGVQRGGDVDPAHCLSVLCFQLFRSES
jgi:hypothetical protein